MTTTEIELRPADAARSSPESAIEADRALQRELVMRARVEAIRAGLRAGKAVDDRTFDDLYPFGVQCLSRVYWTPVNVAVRAARLLARKPGARILDVGSGVGKFCIVAALASRAKVIGVEHRPHLVGIAEHAAARVGVKVQFVAGTLADCDPRTIDGVYLFNPFAENLCASRDRIDPTVELSEPRFRRDIAVAQRFLERASPETRVVTYCGWGGKMPADYRLVLRETCAGPLELWVKARPERPRRPGQEVSAT